MKKYLLLLIVVIFAFNLQGQNTKIDSIYNIELQKCNLVEIPILQSFSQTTEITPFQSGTILSNLLITGNAQLNSKTSLIRVVLVDSNYNEYLVYDNYSLLTDSLSILIDKEYFETGYLSDIVPLKIKIIIDNATLYINKFSYGVLSQMKSTNISSIKDSLISNKNQKNIDRINTLINSENLLWIAGETSFSQLTYQEKKQYFGDTLPNLGGLEYYIGGIFDFNSDNSKKSATNKSPSLIDNFDWRNRHGRNWTTPAKDQGQCGSCWAFGAVGAVEGLVNLYYNQKIDLNLSEQYIVSCSGAGSCQGGAQHYALDYIASNGVVNENCFPYTASNKACNNVCSSPNEKIQIAGRQSFFPSNYSDPEYQLKINLIQKGIISGRVGNWSHAMTLVGYGTIKLGEILYVSDPNNPPIVISDPNDSRIGKTYWIFKNSWGSNWGRSGGYLYAFADIEQLNYSSILLSPITSLNYTDLDIVCEDRDGDGYYNWGIGPKPATCPTCPDTPDCDDSNPMYGPYDERYGCSVLCENYYYDENNPLIISTSQVWEEPMFLNRSIIINEYATLTIKNTIRLGANVSFNVQMRGKLIVDGGVLTSACPDTYWQGINVVGHKGLWQQGINQGIVELKNGAIIENARNAVSLWKPGQYTRTGGIVKASNTTFRNNIRSVEFLSYQNMSAQTNGNLIDNVSCFDNCTFIWDNLMIEHDKNNLSHITMWDVNGVKIKQCSFINENSNNKIIHHGIFSIQSGFYLDQSNFNGLEYGVRVGDVNGRNLRVTNTEFINNNCGVFASSSSNFEITNCNFEINPKSLYFYVDIPDYIEGIGFGIVSDASTGYTIENNYFKGSSLSYLRKRPHTIGIQIVNSGDASNFIKNNTFEELYCASQALGQNRSENAEPNVQGLKYLCNNIENSNYGIYISSYGGTNSLNGICTYQGYPGQPAWNQFINNSISDICNANCLVSYYFYPLDGANLCPNTCNSNINIMGSNSYINNCENSLNNKNELYNNLSISQNEYILMLYNYNNLLDGGQKDELLDKLKDSWSGDIWDLRQEYLNASPYLSSSVLKEMVQSEKLPLAICTEILLSNQEATQKDDFTELMYKESTYLTPLSISLIEESWNTETFRASMERNISNKLGEIELISRSLISIILKDSLGLNIDEYRNILSNMKSVNSKFEMVDSYIGSKNYETANDILSSLQSNDEYQKYYSDEIESYLNYLIAMEKVDTLNNYPQDDLEILSNTNTRAGQKAKSILYFKNEGINYHPIVLLEEETNKYKPAIKKPNLFKDNITIVPNPAKDHIILTYNLPPQQTYIITIYDNKGVELLTDNLKGNKGVQTIELKSLKSGSYYYTITDVKKIIKSDKLIIVK